MNTFLLRLSLLTATVLQITARVQATAVEATESNNTPDDCFDNAKSLQAAIDALPRFALDTSLSSLAEEVNKEEPNTLWLCPGTVIETPQPIRIIQRSVRLGCASTSTTTRDSTDTDTTCTIAASKDLETRLVLMVGGKNAAGEATNTVELNGIAFAGGQNYNQDNGGPGGAAVYAQGVNLRVVGCNFSSNTSSRQGGAISVMDGNRPIRFSVDATSTFHKNVNLASNEDCDSVYFHQKHAQSRALMMTITGSLEGEEESNVVEGDRRERELPATVAQEPQQWDDVYRAIVALVAYQPHEGAILCF